MHDERDGDNPALTELRRRLEAGRVQLRLNKSTLAIRAGLGRTTVSQAFRPGGPVPSTQTVAALAHALRLPVDELLALRQDAAGGGGGERPGLSRMIGKGAAAEVLSPAAGPTHLPTPPPQGVIGRQGSIDALVTALDVAAPAGAHVPPLSIYGIGGIGKTTVAAQVARTLCESGAFPDGLLWAALGPVARPRPLLEAWGRVLGVDLLGEHTVSACSDRLRAALSGTRTLLVIDDVWAAEDAQPFLVAGTRCRTLLTTREPPVATRLSTRAHAHRLDVLLPQDSLDLLGRLAPGVVERHPAQARELCARVEHLPLALTLAGRLLDAESDVPGRMARLLAELTDQRAARLSMPQDEGRLGLCSRTVSLEAILALSVDRLDAIDRERFAALAVLGGDPLTWDLPTAAAVWACALPAAEETVAHLIQRGIVEPRGDDYWMHAVLADYAAELLDGTSR